MIPADTAAQALASFHQDPVIAYNQKSEIWVSDILYSTYFSDNTHADHIIFAFSLLRSVESKKLDLVARSGVETLPESLEQQLHFLRQRGAIFLLTAAIARCLETFLGKAIPNTFRAHFKPGISVQTAQELWSPIGEATIPFCEHLLPAVRKSLKNIEDANQAIKTFRTLVESTKLANKNIYEQFAENVEI